MFERPVTFRHGDGGASAGRIDSYRRGCFVLEAKKLKVSSGETALTTKEQTIYAKGLVAVLHSLHADLSLPAILRGQRPCQNKSQPSPPASPARVSGKPACPNCSPPSPRWAAHDVWMTGGGWSDLTLAI